MSLKCKIAHGLVIGFFPFNVAGQSLVRLQLPLSQGCQFLEKEGATSLLFESSSNPSSSRF